MFFQRLRAFITLFSPLSESPVTCSIVFVSRQTECTNGAKIFLGGLEAAELACGPNPADVDLIVDVRGNCNINRWGEPHRLQIPRNLRYLNFAVNRFCVSHDGTSPHYGQGFGPQLTPIFRALQRGDNVLIHCLNGKNRSAMLALIQHDGGYLR